MKKTLSKFNASFVIVLIIMASGISGSYAWLSTRAEVSALSAMAQVNVSLAKAELQANGAWSFRLEFDNTTATLVRAGIVPIWRSEDGSDTMLDSSDVAISMLSGWRDNWNITRNSDGTIYVNYVGGKNQIGDYSMLNRSERSLEGKFIATWPDDPQYEGKALHIEIIPETIQATGKALNDSGWLEPEGGTGA